MAVSANDEPTSVVISNKGIKGEPGTNGTDGVGFNGVRKALIDNPLSWLYKKNNLVNTLKNVLTVIRPAPVNYTDIYGILQSAPINTPKETVDGWFINSTEIHTYETNDNIPLFDNDFSIVFRVGSYSEGAVNQDMVLIPATSGNLLTIGTDGTGNYIAALQGSDTITYGATTAISATSASVNVIIITYDGSTGVMNLNINNVLSGSATLPTALTATLDLTDVVTLAGNFSLNTQGLRVYDFILNADELTYLND